MKKRYSIAAIAVAAMFAAGGAQAQKLYAFTSLPQGTVNFFQVSALAKVFQQKTGNRARVLPLRGTSLTLAAVNAKEAEFQMGGIPETYDAYVGRGRYKGKPLKNLRVVMNNRPLPIGFFVRKDSDIKTFADLKGKRVPSGWTAFPVQNLYLGAMFKTVGLTFKDMIGVPVPDLIRGANDFKEGKNDGTTFAIGAPKVTEVDAAVGGIRFLSLPAGPKTLEVLHSVHPKFGTVTVKPSKRAVGVLAPTRVFAIDIVVMAGAHVPDDVVYQFVKMAHDGKKDLVKAHPSFGAFHPKNMAKKFAGIPHHPGAIKYYKEIGLWK